MFGSLNRSSFSSLTSTLVRSRAGLIAGSLALAASAAPLMGAGPWDWTRRGTHREIIVRDEHRAYPIARPIEIEPCNVQFTAFQSRDTVMIFATGSNRSGGFTTSLSALDTRGHSVTLKLCNIYTPGCGTQAITGFSINAAIHADCALSTVDIRVGGRVICVPVSQVACIS